MYGYRKCYMRCRREIGLTRIFVVSNGLVMVALIARQSRTECNHKRFVSGRRNGKQPNTKMQEVLKKTIEEARAMVSKVITLCLCVFFVSRFYTREQISYFRFIHYTNVFL